MRHRLAVPVAVGGRRPPRARRTGGAAESVRPRLRSPVRSPLLPHGHRRGARAELRRRPARRGRDPAGQRRRAVPDDRDDARLRRRQARLRDADRPAGTYNNTFYARQGYAVVDYSARGFGRSCGKPDSRTSPGCDAGWIHLADHRYEARDTQHLLGLLVDQGVARPDALGVTGVSYGGIQTLNLARLRNRIRLPDGSFQPWTSPNGTPLEDRGGVRALGRLGPHLRASAERPLPRLPDPEAGPEHQARRGDEEELQRRSSTSCGNASGFYAPKGSAFSADITTWKELADRGEPATRRRARGGQGAHWLPQLGRSHGPERGAARAERLDRRPLPRPRGAARVPHVQARRARASRFSSETSATRAEANDRRRPLRHGAQGLGLLRRAT